MMLNLETLQIVLETVIGVIVLIGLRIAKESRNELKTINGRLGKVEQWAEDHEKRDDERYLGIVDRLS